MDSYTDHNGREIRYRKLSDGRYSREAFFGFDSSLFATIHPSDIPQDRELLDAMREEECVPLADGGVRIRPDGSCPEWLDPFGGCWRKCADSDYVVVAYRAGRAKALEQVRELLPDSYCYGTPPFRLAIDRIRALVGRE